MTTSGTPAPGMEPLARLLSHELNVGDLLGYLVELDPQPLLTALGVRAAAPGLRQEVRNGLRTRVDALVTDAGRPVALLELKVGAAQHGDQFARYAAVAAGLGGIPCHLVALDPFTADVPADWGRHLLPDLLARWRTSPAEPARVVAAELERAARVLLLQAQGPLAGAGRTAVAVAVRRIDHDVRRSLPGLAPSGGPERTGGGQPMLVYWLPHPQRKSEREWLCVDLRSEAEPSSPWRLRIGVEVDKDADGAAPAEARAHELAMGLRDSLRTSALAATLTAAGLPRLAEALSSRHDGFRPGNANATAQAWPPPAPAGPDAPGSRRRRAHPVFHHDYGRRLTTVSHVDCTDVTASDAAELVAAALRHLRAAAAG